MKGKIFLSGGGDLEKAEKIDSIFFEHLSDNSKILYIPIALDRDRLGFKVCYDWFSGIVLRHSSGKDIDFSMILEGDNLPNLNEYEAVYIGGGNTFKLLSYVVENQLDNAIREYVNKGGLVYGGSAGAIIFGNDINTVSEENDSDYKYHKGLDYLSGRSLICHYEPNLDKNIIDSQKRISGDIIALQENEGLIISKDGVDIIGEPWIFVNGNKNKFGKTTFYTD